MHCQDTKTQHTTMQVQRANPLYVTIWITSSPHSGVPLVCRGVCALHTETHNNAGAGV